MKDVVLGIGECAFHLAMLRASRFAVITTLPVSVPVIEQNLLAYGFDNRCARVYAADVGVLEIEREPVTAFRKLSARLEQARDDDDVDAVVLGCAGMADIAARLEQRYGMPVIDGVKAAVALAESVVRLAPASRG
ncbi:MAG: aspartate/glutamate racemase family protein [Pseudomonadota bacterium]